MNDPFASAPADEEAQAAPEAPKKALGAVTVDVKPNVLPATEGKHVVTLKGGSGFDAPWYVIHASGLDELEQLFGQDAARLAALFERIQKAGSHFAGLGVFNGGAPTRQERQPAPEAAQQPSAGGPPCPGPGWEYKTGITKSGRNAGKPYEAWAPPRGSGEKWIFF